jgi:hypothetical protein
LRGHDLDGAAGLTLGQNLADAQDRAQTGGDGPASFLPISSSLSNSSRRRSEWPRMTHVASPASIDAEISPV